MRRSLAAQRLVAVFLTGALLFNYPVLSLFDRPDPWFGMPTLWLFLFAMWAALLAIVAWIVERGAR
jgi:hypothetical protein